jgi:transcriptional regulator with GAF, ATPase, and Fis domain
MSALHQRLRPLLRGDIPVLLVGETGVGKERVARLLHLSSSRRAGPFVAVNCAAIPAELLEAEMFGIGRGVATGVAERPGKFQLAEGGTLFLDEIGEMSTALQAKLLHALQGKEVQPLGGPARATNVRIVTATNSDLEERREAGQFRSDLYFRIAGALLVVPPLRERREDIPELIQSFLEAFARDMGLPVCRMSAGARRTLERCTWPGNVRELEHEVRRLAAHCDEGQEIEAGMIAEHVVRAAAPQRVKAPATLNLAANLAFAERRTLEAALLATGGKRAPAARLLGISRNGLVMKMERLGMNGTHQSEG